MVNTMDKETFNILAHRLRRDIYAQSLRFLKEPVLHFFDDCVKDCLFVPEMLVQ